MISLAKTVAAVVDTAFADPALSGFSLIKDLRGDVLRRYYRANEAAECEVCVYRDKWWTKSGGIVHVDLYCLVEEVQQALGGCSQSWLKPNYERPLAHFQYGLGQSARDLSQEIRSEQEAKQFGKALSAFLVDAGLAWFQQFQSREDISDYFLAERQFYALARYCAHLNDREGAEAGLKQYLRSFPRQNEQELEALISLGLLEEHDRRVLASAALQEQAEYERRVGEWLAARANRDGD